MARVRATHPSVQSHSSVQNRNAISDNSCHIAALPAAMKGDVRVAPNGGVIINKGLSTKAWFRAFSTGTVVGGAAGVVGGFALAQAIYSDEHQRDSVRRAVKITGVAVAASMLAGFLASRRR